MCFQLSSSMNFFVKNILYCRDEDVEDGNGQMPLKNIEQISIGGNPFLDVPVSTNAIEYKKGYVMRKCCYEANAKKSEYYVNFTFSNLISFIFYMYRS